MQADARFVENIQNAHQPAADLGGEADALRFSAGERHRRARQRQIVQTDVDQKSQPRVNLFQNLFGDHRLRLAQMHVVQKFTRIAHRQIGQIGNIDVAYCHREALALEALAFAVRARRLRHKALDLLLAVVRCALAVAPLHIDGDSFKRRVETAAAEFLFVGDVQLVLAGSVEDCVLHLFGQIFVRRFHRNAVLLRQRVKVHARDGTLGAAVPAHDVDASLRE